MQQGKKLNHVMRNLDPSKLPAAPSRPAPSGDGNIARAGAPKRIVDAPISPGMRSRAAQSHLYLHGAPPMDDEPLQKTYEKAAPVHPAMSSHKERGEHVDGRGAAVLTEASNLGRKA